MKNLETVLAIVAAVSLFVTALFFRPLEEEPPEPALEFVACGELDGARVTKVGRMDSGLSVGQIIQPKFWMRLGHVDTQEEVWKRVDIMVDSAGQRWAVPSTNNFCRAGL